MKKEEIKMKKICIVLLGFVLFFGLFAFAQAETVRVGDIDGDGRITAADARAVLRRAARIITFTAEQDARADVDKDGKITVNDARILLRVSAGLETLEA